MFFFFFNMLHSVN